MAPSKNPSNQPGRRGTRSAILRRPPTHGLPLLRHRMRYGWRRLMEMPAVWIAIFVAALTWSMLPQRSLFIPRIEPGTIAARTVVADRDLVVTNEAATREVRDSAQQEVVPVYDLDLSVGPELRRQLGDLFGAGRQMLGDEDAPPPADEDSYRADLVAHVDASSTFEIEPAQLDLLLERRFSGDLEDRLAGVLTRVLRQGVVADRERLLEHRVRGITVRELPAGRSTKVLDLFRYKAHPTQVREAIEADLRGWDELGRAERRAYVDLLTANVEPNLNFNSNATLELRQQAADAVGSVTRTFSRGEVIVRRGERAGEPESAALSQMAGDRDLTGLLRTAAGTMLLLAATVLLLWLVTGHRQRTDRSRVRSLNESLLLLTLAALGARFTWFVGEALAGAIEAEPFNAAASYGLAIPFAALALVAVLLYGRDTALVLSLVFSLFAGHLTGGEANWFTAVYCLIGSLAAVFALDQAQFRQRSVMTRAGLVVGLVNAAAAITLGLMSGNLDGGAGQLGFDLLCAFLGGLLAAAVTSFGIPIFESLFSITTYIKLIELANPNLPLLRRLALEAPGTFQHSLAVANLAKAGAEAIDADSVLIHTGALYHDIGKIFRPQYFIENQPPGQNPHDNIQPSMSALILINHVKEGLELAESKGLPAPILDAIQQHHGTRLIKFFYNRAQERCDPDTEAIREEEFRYSGPKPQSKEMGILMLADAVEAASRTLVEPSRQKIRTVLQAVFEDCLKDGQLDQTDLTLGDLHRVEDAFLRVLTNIYHRRIDYPGFDFNKGGKSAPKTTTQDSQAGETRRKAS
ncbi:MAG: HDIG domain-containing metalloprotein [Acidobacteriota bacterium]